MPKRKIKEEKPRRRFGKKEMLIAPIAIGAGMLVTFIVIPTFFPPPRPTEVCLKALNHETFQLYPRIEILVDGHQKWLPDDVGRLPKHGQDCVRPIRTDQVGDVIHIEYIRAVRLNLADFMKVYTNGTDLITVIDNSTKPAQTQVLNLTNYDVKYSYYSDQGKWVYVDKPADTPPFPTDNKLVERIELASKPSTNK